MAKRKAKGGKRRAKPKPEAIEYRDSEGNALWLRVDLSPGSMGRIGEAPARAASTLDDHWQRREEMLFEYLAVSWEVSGVPLSDQKMLLGRYRMASPAERRWVRATIAAHIERHIPDLNPGA